VTTTVYVGKSGQIRVGKGVVIYVTGMETIKRQTWGACGGMTARLKSRVCVA